jgi:uncharacterized LabA/DUF88 family protein
MPKPKSRSKPKTMKVHELIEKLESLDPMLTISVFTARGDYGTPQVALVSKDGDIDRATITAAEDE